MIEFKQFHSWIKNIAQFETQETSFQKQKAYIDR